MTTVIPLILGPDDEGQILVTDGDRIDSFGSSHPENAAGSYHLNCLGARIEPGAVNAHTHIYSALAPLGMPPPEPPPENFVQILERVWWPLDRALDADSLRASARLYAAESLLAGTTTLIDHHESPNFIEGSLDVLADACQEIGVRTLLCYGATERNDGLEEAQRGLEECRRFQVSNERSLVRGLVALHASFTVSDETITNAARLCGELGTVMHVHVAEDLADVQDASTRGYDGPLERLLAFDALPPGSILAHCVYCDESQVHRIERRQLWIVQNPRSNRGNRVGYPLALGASEKVSLGTDGYAAKMDDEAEALESEALAHGEDLEVARRRIHTGHTLIAERFSRAFAPLGRGASADLVVRDLTAGDDGSSARHVVVDGRVVVRDGQLLTADINEIRAEAQQQAPRLWERMRAL